ncbi:MAG: Alpha,alpha-trehalose-phosphate synthase [Deltaproteobacteria bacterium]|nr:Alpha,alpha-trehalose-phosphate synthase [Deltaproteobacteria bacterium]
MPWQQLVTSPHVVAALDLDGTLIPFAPTPHEATVNGDAAALLEALSKLPGLTVGVISGRPLARMEELPKRFPALLCAAEHGVWRYADGAWEASLPPIPQLDEIELSLTQLAHRYPGALIERKSCSVCLHWRRVVPEHRALIAAAAEVIVDEWLETHHQLERLPVTEALEVRHRAAHKGGALSWLRNRGPQGAIVLAIGDDITDEDMFVSLRENDLGILVAEYARRTQATLRLPSPAAVHRFLGWLIEARKHQPSLATQPEGLEIARLPRPTLAPRLIVASNRLPAAPSTDRQREVGGLVSALLPALAENSGIWLGWSGLERDPGLRLRIEPSCDHETITRAQFDYPPTWRQRFYAGFCNQSLWPLLHGFPPRVRYVDDEWACYVDANRAYAAMLLEAGGQAAEIWVQDFHLMLAGRELRRAGHRGRIGFYLHVPFPPLDVFETMPWAAEVLAAVLEFDRIGLQCQRWADNFFATARGLLGGDGEVRARDRVRVIPVGIDPDRFAEAAAADPKNGDLGSFEEMLAGRKLILGVDRLDYSKGIPERLEAFARLLERFPEWRSKVSFVQVSVPTRSEVPEYAELRSRVEALVGRINGAFGEADWTPVRYLYRSYDQGTLARLYRHASVGLVTPLRDGMNLVAKEYVAAQDPDDPGVLVLSRFCGAAEHMTFALLTNPYHVDGVAANLDEALRMPRDERVARNSSLRVTVWHQTAGWWTKTFLESLRA